jgi:hypothetical protein
MPWDFLVRFPGVVGAVEVRLKESVKFADMSHIRYEWSVTTHFMHELTDL